ncbi:MAG: 2-oxo acid dehydrogenase subunit E2, partial [Clostridia bacterium]|nr:2-oxo acid dehydrogenase subunit E2 [Clostridia bacterium]
VIRCTEAYTTNELAELMCNASGRCSRFVSKPQEFQEGTFTVADLGGFGIDFFTPELTPPELCVLGIGTVAMQIKADERGGIEAYPAIRLTLAYDRAGIDAIRAAEFLNELAVRLEPDKLKQ